MEFIDRMIVACAHGLGRAGMFLVTLWVRFVFVVICLAVLGVLGLARRPPALSSDLFRARGLMILNRPGAVQIAWHLFGFLRNVPVGQPRFAGLVELLH